ncbi:hypothetical protein D3C76_1772390 [compost metagenome]
MGLLVLADNLIYQLVLRGIAAVRPKMHHFNRHFIAGRSGVTARVLCGYAVTVQVRISILSTAAAGSQNQGQHQQ